jgi:hypothetical protein
VKYEPAKMFDEAVELVEKKKVNMVKAVQFLTKLKHLEMSSYMESSMEQMINQMNLLHLLQPRINKSKNVERDLSTIQCYKCWEMGH